MVQVSGKRRRDGNNHAVRGEDLTGQTRDGDTGGVLGDGVDRCGQPDVQRALAGTADEEVALMRDRLDVPLEDSVLLEEMDLTTGLIIAASETVARLPVALVDRLLGVEPMVRQPSGIPRPRESADPTS